MEGTPTSPFFTSPYVQIMFSFITIYLTTFLRSWTRSIGYVRVHLERCGSLIVLVCMYVRVIRSTKRLCWLGWGTLYVTHLLQPVQWVELRIYMRCTEPYIHAGTGHILSLQNGRNRFAVCSCQPHPNLDRMSLDRMSESGNGKTSSDRQVCWVGVRLHL